MREADTLRSVDLVRAEKAYRQAVSIYPAGEQARAELGCFLADRRRFPEACDCFRRALAMSRPSAAAPGNEDAGREAIQLLEEIVQAHPVWTRGLFTLGCAYEALRDYAPARNHLARALALDSSLETHVRGLFASMNWMEGKAVDAVAEADLALLADPSNRVAHSVRGLCCGVLGRMEEAVAGYRRALETIPDPTLHRSLLFALNFLPDTTPETLYAEACRWNELYAAPLAGHIRPHHNVPDPERRLKIGYVSPDLYNHAIMRFLPPLFEHHDRSRFEVRVYSLGATTDNLTEEVRRSVDHYVAFRGSGEELTELIREDGIDILIDLAGPTMDWAFYQAFARKPAPVQVSWMGVVSTTGLTTMDYFLGDALLPCPGTEHLFSETVYRIPGACYAYRPFADIPVAPAPCLTRGYITFGAYHRAAKITRQVVHLWARVLHAVPGSRLLIKYSGMDTETQQQRYIAWFAEEDIAKERLEFAGASVQKEYLASYGNIDIALDPFPYNGGSTSLDTMWMGVPIVTLTGRLPVQRCGAEVLTLVGSPDLVAETPDQYVEAAVFLSQAVSKIPGLRHNVRRALQNSSIMDEPGLARRVEDAFRDMWRTWCRTRSQAS
ncbi:MAG TPA: hypothetical protein VN667_14320 [Burkholderiales bacterium]|nr:hypothetical protein [Burkholderiales bacterium]